MTICERNGLTTDILANTIPQIKIIQVLYDFFKQLQEKRIRIFLNAKIIKIFMLNSILFRIFDWCIIKKNCLMYSYNLKLGLQIKQASRKHQIQFPTGNFRMRCQMSADVTSSAKHFSHVHYETLLLDWMWMRES